MSTVTKQSYPNRTMRNIGDMMFVKQKGDETRPELALWDYVRKCDPECPIREICPATSTICMPEKEYLQHVIRLIFEYEEKKIIDRHGLHVFGTAILPLYQHLFLFKVEAMGLESPILCGKIVTVHPIYKEIRATMKLITSMWAAIGIKSASVPNPSVPAGDGQVQPLAGYYELVQSARTEKEEDDTADAEEGEETGRDLVDPTIAPPKPRNDYVGAAGGAPVNVVTLLAAAESINNAEDADILRMEQEVNEAATNHTNFKGGTGLSHRKRGSRTKEVLNAAP